MSFYDAGDGLCSHGWALAALTALLADTGNNGFVSSLSSSQLAAVKSMVGNPSAAFLQGKGWGITIPVSTAASGAAGWSSQTTTVNLSTKGGSLLLLGFGSGFVTAGGPFNLYLKIDGVLSATGSLYFNTINQHQAFTPAISMLASGVIAPGAHIVSLSVDAGVTADSNDHFTALVLEVPW